MPSWRLCFLRNVPKMGNLHFGAEAIGAGHLGTGVLSSAHIDIRSYWRSKILACHFSLGHFGARSLTTMTI